MGVLPRDASDLNAISAKHLTPDEKEIRKFLLRILGSGISVGGGRLLAPRIILDQAKRTGSTVYAILTTGGDVKVHHVVPLVHFLPYIDPRTKEINSEVDAMLTIVPVPEPILQEAAPRPIHWGDSTDLGAGDAVMVAGFPLGSDLFFEHRSNRGVIQPTLYAATIAAIVPATTSSETRLLRLTIPGLGGLSGGVVFRPRTGEMLGMIVSATLDGLVPAPVLYAIPSEALQPFVRADPGIQ